MASKNDEMAKPSTSKSKTQVRLQKESLQLISRVLEKCELEKNVLREQNNPLEQAQTFTGLHKDYLLKLRGGEGTDFDVTTVDRRHIQNQLTEFYLKYQLPTTYQLFHALHRHKNIPEYMDIRSFRKTLVKLGYMWRKIYMDANLLFVIERPSVTFERYFYLKNIIRCREELREIYFVDELILTSTCEVFDIDEILELKDYIPKELVSKHVIYAITDQSIKFATYYDNYDLTNIETWLQVQLFRSVIPRSVVVLRNKEHLSQELLEKPTLDSLKVEMKDWLDFYNVPYEETMSKIELYTLVEKFTNNIDKLYKIDNIVKTFGTEILRLPESIKYLTPARWVHAQIQKHLTEKNDFEIFFQLFQDIISPNENQYIQNNYVHLTNEEKETLDADMKIDKIMDSVVEKLKKREIDESLAHDSDLPNYTDSE